MGSSFPIVTFPASLELLEFEETLDVMNTAAKACESSINIQDDYYAIITGMRVQGIERPDIDMSRTMISKDIKWPWNTEKQTRKLAPHIVKTCGAAIVGRLNCIECKPTYWWNMKLAELKKKCVQARSKPQRQSRTAE
uniref:Uncharacterized protein n=1 Tax=Glossina palpalis gambiensis TaxID=67801 RepID=A0A1B0BYF1_9MUSC